MTRTIRKQTGNFLEDFRPGQRFRHKGGKTITEGLFTTFTEFAMTANPLAKNARYARAYGFEGLVVPPGLAMLVAFSQTVEDVSENARTNREYVDMRFGAPIYVGDTIEVETKVLSVVPHRKDPNLGIVHVQSTARKNVGSRSEAVVMTWQRKVDVFKRDPAAELHPGEAAPDAITCELWLPPYDPSADYKSMAHLSSPDSYLEDLVPGTRIEHSRGRTMTSEHIHLTAVLDNTSQVHCNQFLIDQDPERYVGGQLIVFGGIPFTLCLGLSSPDVGDNALGDIAYPTGRHVAPLFAGDTVFAATEIRAVREFPGRPDLGVVEAVLFGHKFAREASAPASADAPAGWKKVPIFELERRIAVKRRSHYA
jgi:2-methylfumaryl-CoA hydratase